MYTQNMDFVMYELCCVFIGFGRMAAQKTMDALTYNYCRVEEPIQEGVWCVHVKNCRG